MVIKRKIKRKSVLIIIVSSLIISSILPLTIFGFYAYLEWKEQNIRRSYELALYELNGRVFEQYIILNLHTKIDTEEAFKGDPVVWGTIKNISNKKLRSLKLKVSFHASDQRVSYVDTFYPIGPELESVVNLNDITNKTENFLGEGDSISFKHKLKNCPKEVEEYLASRLEFAKSGYNEPFKLTYKIEGLDIR